MDAPPEREDQPEPWLNPHDGLVWVRCDTSGKTAVSNTIGDAEAVIYWIAWLCDVAGLELDDAELPGSLVVSIPAGS